MDHDSPSGEEWSCCSSSSDEGWSLGSPSSAAPGAHCFYRDGGSSAEVPQATAGPLESQYAGFVNPTQSVVAPDDPTEVSNTRVEITNKLADDCVNWEIYDCEV